MTGRAHDHQALVDTYARHHLREETILARIVRQRGTLDGISELDLAHDSLTEITDQNHVGGIASVVQLALRAGVTAESRVLDIGAGLGGSARCLAHLFGCRVDGIELSPQRCGDANRLTARVGLSDRVTCRCGDVLSVELASNHYDVIWGQGAWTHIADSAALFDRAFVALVPGGRIAFEEPYLTRPARGDEEARTLSELEHLWGGDFRSADAWRTVVSRAGFRGLAVDDLTREFAAYFDRLQMIARTVAAGAYPAHESDAFGHAITLARAGVLGYSRFVAVR